MWTNWERNIVNKNDLKNVQKLWIWTKKERKKERKKNVRARLDKERKMVNMNRLKNDRKK